MYVATISLENILNTIFYYWLKVIHVHIIWCLHNKYSSIICSVVPYDVTISADFNGDVTVRPAVVEYGDVLILNCTASGGPDNMFSWLKDNILLQESTDNILTIAAVNAANGGLYECVVDNTAGNSSANITIYGGSCLSFNILHEVCFI